MELCNFPQKKKEEEDKLIGLKQSPSERVQIGLHTRILTNDQKYPNLHTCVLCDINES